MVARNGVTNLNKKILLSWILLKRERDGVVHDIYFAWLYCVILPDIQHSEDTLLSNHDKAAVAATQSRPKTVLFTHKQRKKLSKAKKKQTFTREFFTSFLMHL